MALYLFTDAILAGRPIQVFNHGKMRRDFTYIDDIVEGVVRTCDQPATSNPDWDPAAPDPGTSTAPYRVFNIGNNQPVELAYFIEVIENALGVKANKELLPIQPGDVPATYANIDDLQQAVGFAPRTSIEDGVARFVQWYRSYHQPV
jgi:UDP-glucuronate 4-epimerase